MDTDPSETVETLAPHTPADLEMATVKVISESNQGDDSGHKGEQVTCGQLAHTANSEADMTKPDVLLNGHTETGHNGDVNTDKASSDVSAVEVSSENIRESVGSDEQLGGQPVLNNTACTETEFSGSEGIATGKGVTNSDSSNVVTAEHLDTVNTCVEDLETDGCLKDDCTDGQDVPGQDREKDPATFTGNKSGQNSPEAAEFQGTSDQLDTGQSESGEFTSPQEKADSAGMVQAPATCDKQTDQSQTEDKIDSVTDKVSEISEGTSATTSADVESASMTSVKSSAEKIISGSSSEMTQSGPASASAAESAGVQSPDKPVKYKCPKCSRVMKDKRLIDNHSCDNDGEEEKVKITITLDKDKKSFVCQECDYSNSGHGFEEHLMCHLMVRPYQCLYCKECFINRKEISRHVLKSHNGAKMSCALRALRKAKALIKDVTSLGVTSFMAKVAGRVPLEKDPEKKKKTDGSNDSEVTGKKVENEQSSGEQQQEETATVQDATAPSDTLSKPQNPPVFSKLREVLTSGTNPSPPSGSSKEEEMEEKPKAKESSNETGRPQDSESGLKIVASYSLHQPEDETSQPEEKDQPEDVASNCPEEPNFIIPQPVEKEKEPEVLSFLGPDQPIYKTADENTSPLLPPPPLQPAPSHSSADGSTLPPPPPLASGAQQMTKNPNFFVCGFNCLFSSLSTAEFKEHTVNFHSTETYFPCYYCGHRSPNENDLVRHISNHTHTHNKTSPLYVCGNDGCRFGTNMVTDYISHIKASHPEISEPLCYSCGVIFPDVTMLQHHVEENVIHIVNCPHCPSKATDRRTILKHISTNHPGKPKMVSVAKQLICHDRKLNNYEEMKQLREMLPPTLTPAPNYASGGSVIDQILSRQEPAAEYGKSSSLSEMLSSRSSISPRNSPSPSAKMLSPSAKRKLATPDHGKSPNSEHSDLSSVKVKEEMEDDRESVRSSGDAEEQCNTYAIDENGVRRRIYVPMSERQAENYKCKHCTFIARDLKRLHCHERSHGMPPTRKERFKCMFCPQGFDSEMKFRLHITCHPGLIKFLLYRCKKCEFDTNQKHTIVKHITCNRDRKHRGFGPVEDQYTLVSRSLESRVLECERCDYMTRHKIHMAIHYQREHSILRDKGEFTIEGLAPTDTPLSTYDHTPHDQTPSPAIQNSLQSPDGHSSSLEGVFDFTKPMGSAKKSKDKSSSDHPPMTISQITERNELFKKMVSRQAALQPGQVLENQMRKFKCPICKYLLPKAADLKNHVKRHSEIGQITLVMFRCKYCSCMSTARELLYDHLNEKHPGKPIALVKKIVAIDTTEVDKSFAETSMEESLDQLEESLHKEMMTNCNSPPPAKEERSSPAYEKLFVIPEGGETFSAALQCPKCEFSSFNKSEIVNHVTVLHSEIKVISSDEDVDNLAKATSEDLQQEAAAAAAVTKSGTKELPRPSGQEEVLIVPDEQIFKEPAMCSRCNFSTTLRREMVTHLQKNHPDISVMGRNSYPVQVAAMGRKLGPMEESCVVGSGSLDAKIRCLYENYGTQMKCLICGTERPKKFFIHVHILRHLNIYLWKCAFCAHRGLQKYKMVDHIKKIHPGRPMSVRYIRVNVENKVAQFLAQFNVIKNRKASLDEGMDVPFMDELTDHTSNDSSQSQHKSPVPGGSSSNQCPCTLGSEELDERISCLYDYSDGVFYKCIACPNQFQRKFAIHRHIIISHLKVALLSCTYCGMEGVEKHQMVDHILACHKSQPISIQTLEVDIGQKVSQFLAKMADGGIIGGAGDADRQEVDEIMHNLSTSSSKSSDFADDYYNRMFRPYATVKPKPIKFKSSLFSFGNKSQTSTASAKKNNAVDPDVIMLGRAALDKELACLYKERPMGQLRCLVCRWEFPRKYPLHRHIMLKHLKLNLVGCPYCPFEGVEKYNVSTHIKEEHKDKPINIKYTQPDVATRVREFVDDSFGSKSHSFDIRRNAFRDSSPLVVPKVERDEEEEEEEDEEGENNNTNDEEEKSSTPASEHRGGLVVAMFGKKKRSPSIVSDDVIVKTETVDEEYEEGSALHEDYNGEEVEEEVEDESQFEENDDYNEDDDPGADKSNYDPASDSSRPTSFSTLRRPLMESYAPGAYRSPAGGKPKALDVITKIKVLKAKEGPITKFYCEMCKFTSLHRSNIVRHIYKIHEKYQTHTCPVCNYQTLSLMLMQKHTEKEHPGVEYKEDAFTLNPPRSKPRSRPIIGPLSYQRKRQSLLMKKLAAQSRTSTTTTTTSSSQGPKQYACAYCHYETNTQEDILQHTRDNHSQNESQSAGSRSPSASRTIISKPEDRFSACWDGSKKAVKRKLQEDSEGIVKRKRRFVFEKGDELVQCGHCDTRETSMARMQDHMAWDHPGLPFQAKHIPAWRFVCKSCAVKTMATSKMKYHLNRHVNYRPYTCPNCGAFFPSPDQCRRHSRAQGHEEQYTYVRNPKKEARVEELLENTRQLALTIQIEAAKDPDFDISHMDTFISKFQDSRSNLKRNAPMGSLKNLKRVREGGGAGGEAGPPSKLQQHGKSAQTVGIEQDITIKCYHCDFKAPNVFEVRAHHVETHAGERFLWTELDRGFTCDETGEALPECETVPSSSSDVGYTTKMTLGSGSNTMRFKCKTCNFSSCVIQAMKSHLKSHQPKGFICPYCSRSFSGKEKLMRHQYCLHKGHHLWVIHLRRAGVAGSTGIKKNKPGEVTADTNPDTVPQTGDSIENKEKDSSSSAKFPTKRFTAQPTTYHCSECSYVTTSLYHYRLHLAQQHEEFKYKVHDTSIDSPLKCGYCTFLAETEAEFSTHIETHFSERSFQCGYCDYSAYDRVSVQRHLGSNHASLSPRVIDLGATSRMGQEYVKGHERRDLPLLLNLMPDVTVERVPESVLSQYGCVAGEGEEDSEEEEEEGEGEREDDEEEDVPDNSLTEGEGHHSDDEDLHNEQSDDFNIEVPHDDEEEGDDRLMVVEGVSEVDMLGDEDAAEEEEIDHEQSVDDNDDGDNGEDEVQGEKIVSSRTGSMDSDLAPVPGGDAEELARQLGLVEDQTSCVLGPETDMMIMQFGGMAGDSATDSSAANRSGKSGPAEAKTLGAALQQINLQMENTSPSVSRSKDSTLFSAQETAGHDDNNINEDVDDEDDDDDEEVNFDNDITLASPLPMISLGDGVAMSPVGMDSHPEVGDDSSVLKSGGSDNQEILLDM